MQVISKLLRSKFAIKKEELDKLDVLKAEMMTEFASLGQVKVKVAS